MDVCFRLFRFLEEQTKAISLARFDRSSLKDRSPNFRKLCRKEVSSFLFYIILLSFRLEKNS